jgi:hypothetical protein
MKSTIMFRPPTADQSPTNKVAQQLAEVANQLCREFAPAGGIAAEVVRGHVQQVRAGFGSPKVLTYLPVLVERAVRHRLSATPLHGDTR